jgi:hypothetical protein
MTGRFNSTKDGKVALNGFAGYSLSSQSWLSIPMIFDASQMVISLDPENGIIYFSGTQFNSLADLIRPRSQSNLSFNIPVYNISSQSFTSNGVANGDVTIYRTFSETSSASYNHVIMTGDVKSYLEQSANGIFVSQDAASFQSFSVTAASNKIAYDAIWGLSDSSIYFGGEFNLNTLPKASTNIAKYSTVNNTWSNIGLDILNGAGK